MVCFGTRERDTAKGKEKLVGRGWRVRGGPARKMAGKMEGSLSIMPGPSASLYASNNSLIDLRKTGHLRAEKTPLSPAFVCPSVFPPLPLVHTNRAFFFSSLPLASQGGEENPRASWTRSRLRFPAVRGKLAREESRGDGRVDRNGRIEDKRARIEKRAFQRKSAFPLSVDALSFGRRRPPPS